jgi:hypothetical protein
LRVSAGEVLMVLIISSHGSHLLTDREIMVSLASLFTYIYAERSK